MKTIAKWMASAALFAALTVGSFAQESFSANAVGFLKIELPPGLSLVSTPFVGEAGAIPTIGDVFGTNVPNLSIVHIFRPPSTYETFRFIGGEWYKGATGGQHTNRLERGSGVWFMNPASTNVSLSVLGEVPGGAEFEAEIVDVPVGLSIVSFSFPIPTPVSESGLTPVHMDEIHAFDPVTGYVTYRFIVDQWYQGATPVDFVFEPGKAYWYYSQSTKEWIQPKPYVWP